MNYNESKVGAPSGSCVYRISRRSLDWGSPDPIIAGVGATCHGPRRLPRCTAPKPACAQRAGDSVCAEGTDET